jgi:hypothetical protein
MKLIFSAILFALTVFASAQTSDVKVSTLTYRDNDGRFTLGNGDKRLMYGFPVPLSTSHFVIKVDTVFLTNNPAFARRKRTVYLKGTTTITGSNSMEVTTEYTYKKLKIYQILTPIDKNLKDISAGTTYAQYYKTTLKIKNENDAAVTGAAMLLYDTMIEDNDACRMGIGKNKIDECASYKGAKIPGQIFVYKDTAQKGALIGEIRTFIDAKYKPAEVHIGNWPQFYSLLWDIPDQGKKKKYNDSAVLIKWAEVNIPAGTEYIFECAYGIPSYKQSELNLLVTESNLKTRSATIYFDLGDAGIDLNGEMRIKDLIDMTKNIKGVTIHGYSDAYGGDEGALELSQKRIDAVAKIFEEYEIPFVPKPHGNYDSDFSDESVKKGNVKDRKVIIELIYKDK